MHSDGNTVAAGSLLDLLRACGSFRGSILREFGNAGVSFVRNRWTEWFAGGRMLSWLRSPSSSSAKKKNGNNNINSSSEKKKKEQGQRDSADVEFQEIEGEFHLALM